jgi:hypothetical protein
MPCCGRASGTTGGFNITHRPQSSHWGSGASGVIFEYVGATGLTAVGGVTRRTYIFGLPGAKVAVDSRDVASLAAIPLLRQVR